MKAISAKVTDGITLGTRLICDDNSGAKVLYVINILGKKGRRGRNPKGGVGDVIIASVKKGNEKMRKKLVRAVIIRQRMPYRRRDGTWIQFEDNAAALIDELGQPLASEIKGVVAREVAERYPKVAGVAPGVV